MRSLSVIAVGDTPGHVVDQLGRLAGPVTVARRAADLAEVLAACQSGLADAAIVADGTRELSATLVDRLAAVGVAVVVLADDPADTGRLRDIGAVVVGTAVTAAGLADAVAVAVAARAHRGRGGSHGWGVDAGARPAAAAYDGGAPGSDVRSPAAGEPDSSVDGPGTSARVGYEPEPNGTKAEDGDRPAGDASIGYEPRGGPERVRRNAARRWWQRRTPGPVGSGRADSGPGSTALGATGPRVLAVWGPAGAPGRTTVALNLGAELAARGHAVLLVDADTYGASMAAGLGLLDEAASLAQACRLADQGLLTPGELGRIATEVVFAGGTLRLLTGLTRADRWPEIRAAAFDRVLAVATQLADVVVIDCGFCLERDEELSYDTMAPRRNAAALCALDAATEIHAVGTADVIGMPRLVRALAEVDDVVPGKSITVVFNKVRKTATGPGPRRALDAAWQRFGPAHPIARLLPWEPETTDRALFAGRLLMEVAPESGLRRAIAGLACASVQQNSKTTVGTSRATVDF
ncbi:AAA family ATPase [Specibacter cremeus]|uniref:AAA family ATPase n=1 Tax=Specibacter cremeus TaxID=1629051 RepID=UPI000F7A6C79|nr:chromosome partitioning protein [Specibacter cremeus]